MLTDAALKRYSRQLMLPDFDLEQQERLADSHVLIVGCGGLGSSLALYLAAAGVGEDFASANPFSAAAWAPSRSPSSSRAPANWVSESC